MNSVVANLLGQEDTVTDMTEILKASAVSKCEQIAAIFAAIAEQLEASETIDDLAGVVITMQQVAAAKVYTETKKSINALKPHIPRSCFHNAEIEDTDED